MVEIQSERIKGKKLNSVIMTENLITVLDSEIDSILGSFIKNGRS